MRGHLRTGGGWAAGLVLVAMTLGVTGCGQEEARFYEYPYGKINLDRVTYVTPRIKVGLDEFPLNPEGIAKVVAKLEAGEYSFFHVQAVILFDEFAWQVYKSEAFDKDKRVLTPEDIRRIEKELKHAYKLFKQI